ncbi:MAG: hypothetical protein KAI06_07655, partial [Anaerolineales bacterium]|nr:hypothetical protein [Anaerolineales bacterium]
MKTRVYLAFLASMAVVTLICLCIGVERLSATTPVCAAEDDLWDPVGTPTGPMADKDPDDAASHPVPQSPLWLTYQGAGGPGSGKHIVLIAADQEYRSEQSMPMLAGILSKRHGFDCTVLFSVNDKGESDPTMPTHFKDKNMTHDIPGLEHLGKADLLILFSRMITLPDKQVKHVIDYLDSGKPIIGIRTANHGFLKFPYEVNGKRVRFGDDVLGGAFRGHHGNWHADSTRGILVEA